MEDIQCVVLAAGFSRRANAFKMTLDLAGKTVLGRSIESLSSVCSRIVVVGGYRIGEIAKIVKDFPKVSLVYNENYQSGMFSSVKKGLENAGGSRVFLSPGDYPAIATQTYTTMLESDAEIVVPVFYEKKGHPVLLKSNLIEEILESKHISLREFIEERGYTRVPVLDCGILMDVDTPSDYNALCLYLAR